MGWRRVFAAVPLVAVLYASPALAADPRAESCKLAAVLADGTDAIIGQFEEMAKLWDEAERAKLDPVFRPELGKFDFDKGKVYLIADFDPFMREYMVVSGDASRAVTIFFRLSFARGPRGYMFRNVDFNTDYSEIMASNLAQPPQEIGCL